MTYKATAAARVNCGARGEVFCFLLVGSEAPRRAGKTEVAVIIVDRRSDTSERLLQENRAPKASGSKIQRANAPVKHLCLSSPLSLVEHLRQAVDV